jgi:glycosyltransferase involved in cell wall biosynthesis
MKKEKPTIAVIIPCWQRARVLEAVSDQLDKFVRQNKEKATIVVVFIFSKEDPELKELKNIYSRAAYPKVVLTEPNLLLGAKLNTGIQYAFELNFDYVMNMGSDDLLHPALIDLYMPYIEEEVPFFGVNKLYFYNTEGETIFFDYYNRPHIVGAGRMIHKSVLKRVFDAYQCLYDPDVCKAMDGHSSVKITSLGYEVTILDPGQFPFIVDIKTDTNINSFDKILNSRNSEGIHKVANNIITSVYPELKEI